MFSYSLLLIFNLALLFVSKYKRIPLNKIDDIASKKATCGTICIRIEKKTF